MTSVLFLDIDGPLLPARAFIMKKNLDVLKNGGFTIRNHFKCFDPVAVEFFNLLQEIKPDLRFVISSTWANLYEKEELVDIFEQNGLNIILHDDWVTPKKFSSQRFHEIGFWLDDNPDVTEFVVVDDMDPPPVDRYPNHQFSDNIVQIFNNWVLVNFDNGLSRDNFAAIFEKLGLNYKSLFEVDGS